MDIKFKHVEGSQAEAPVAVDTTSSKFVIYIRENIEQVEKEVGGETVLMWEYDEAELTPAEYYQYLTESNTGRIAENEDAMCEMSTEMDARMTEIENALCELSEGGTE